uniref:CSON014743 protein n=1 Tax=Culicoides sonorensis TaxID=179676 RepID=A0A336MBH0_CULSO
MAQLITVRLTRNDNQPWGFRLQGGKDFGSPLALQKVNVGSIADKAGLLAGDALIKVNNEELFNLRHKDAQDAIVRAGASFELTVSRGGSTWKPAVTPLTSPVPTSAGVNVLTKTSLQAKPGQNPAAIGTGHNTAARPFASKEPSVKSVVNKQYNSPVAMYSDETIAETLSAQTEVLAGGVLGVNFKKNEKVYNSAQSEVFKMLQEQGNEPEPARPSSVYSPSSHFPQHPLNDQHSSVSDGVTKHVTAPVNVPKPPSNNGLPPGQNICADCERLIVGVFVRIKDKNLHVECFKCSTCGSSLKNQGYYNFNNKLYCDIHAKLAAMSSPPPNTNGLVPVTVPPKAPTSTISSALNAHAGALNGSSVAPAVPTTAHCVTVEIAWATPSHSRTSSMSSGYGNSNSSLKNSPIVQSPSHSRQSSGVSLSDLKLIDNLDGSNSQQVSDEEKESEISGNLYYKTINGGIIRSVKPPNKNNGEFKYKLPSSISGPKPFSYAPVPAPAPVSAPKSPIAYPPPAAPAWTAPVSAPVQTAPAWTPAPAPVNEAAKAPAAQQLQDIKPMKMVGNPTEMLEQSVRELKLNNGKPSSKFKNDASQVISAMLEARLKLTQPKPLQKEIPLPPLPKSSPPKHDTVTLHSSINNKLRNMKKLNENIGEEREKLDEKILSIIPTTTEVDVFVKRNSINNNNNNKSHASNRLSYVETFNNNNNKIDTNDKENEKINKNSAETNNKIVNGIQNGELPICCKCNVKITTGPFITALGRIWCPEHFICVNANCKRPLADIGFVEEKGDLYCEYCFEQYLAPNCSKCVKKIKGDCLNAIGRQFHPECFTCSYCGKLFGNSPFFLEEGEPYCQNDWNELFTTKCFACGFPVEAGDRWVEALNNNYHSQCFNCTMCKKNLEGQSFYAKGGRPFCKNHAQYNYLKKKTQFIINLNISKYFNTITHIMYVNNKIKTILKFKFKH